MTSTYYNQITDDMIADALGNIAHYEVEWTGSMPADTDPYDVAAGEKIREMTVADVRGALQNDISGDSAEDEIRMAISIAAEPDDLPDYGCVAIHLASRF